MKLYRISTTEHIGDLTGTGAKIYGGRWNNPGYPVIYTSSSRSLAALEFLVHVPMALAPAELSIIEIHIKKSVSKKKIKPGKLPKNWKTYPAPEKLAEIGTHRLQQKTSLLLEIPSAVVGKELNVLINPLHPEANKISIAKVEKFSFDPRLSKIG